MKQKNIAILLAFISLLWCINACQDDDITTDQKTVQQNNKQHLSTSEAKEYFESVILKTATKGSNNEKKGGFDPGILQPHWDKAIESSDRFLSSVDIESNTSYRYKIGRVEFKKGEYRTYWVTPIQRLVVVKSPETQQKEAYLLTIIPEKGYEQKNKGKIAQKIINSKTRGDYSGLLIYTTLEGRMPVRVSLYKDGKYIDGAFLYDPKYDKADNFSQIMRFLKPLFIKYKQPLTRAIYDENTNGDTETTDELDRYLPYRDKDGNYYTPYDSDGDGINDRYMIGSADAYGDTSNPGNGAQTDPNTDHSYPEDIEDEENTHSGGSTSPNPDPGNSHGSTGSQSTSTKIPAIPINNPSLKASVERVLNKVKAPITITFINVLNNSNINFVPSNTSNRVIEITTYKYPSGYKFKMSYNESIINQLGNMAIDIIVVHELYHIRNHIVNGTVNDPLNPNATNDRDHDDMVNDAEYENHMKQLFPGQSDEFYMNIVYAGTMGSPVFKNITRKRRRELIQFFYSNNIY